MIKGLYPAFEFFNEYNNIWILSDPHFGDSDMLEYFNYPSPDEEVKMINSKIGKKDLFICLGDVGDIKYVKKIRGDKILIKGNHDSGASNYQLKEEYHLVPSDMSISDIKLIYPDFVSFLRYDDSNDIIEGKNKRYAYCSNKLFMEVYEGPVFISEKILLSHEPIDYPYALNIHGHDHSGWFNKENHLNVCANKINFTPVNLKHIVESGVLKNIKDIHRNCIDEATRRKMKRN